MGEGRTTRHGNTGFPTWDPLMTTENKINLCLTIIEGYIHVTFVGSSNISLFTSIVGWQDGVEVKLSLS